MAKKKHLILDWIKDYSTSTIYSRGASYRSNVYNLKAEKKKDKTIYSAEVIGTEEYEVNIHDLGGGVFMSECDCPFDYEDVCKHVVAVALEIADKFVEEDLPPVYEKTVQVTRPTAQYSTPVSSSAPSKAGDFFDTVFQKADPKTQVLFLRQLFEKNKEVCTQFTNFVNDAFVLTQIFGPTPPISPNLSKTAPVAPKPTVVSSISKHIDVATLSKEIHTSLSNIKFDAEEYYDEQDDEYDDYNHYDDEDGLETWAENKIKEVTDVYYEKIKTNLQNGDLLNVVKIYIALYNAAQDLPEIEESDYGPILDDYEYSVLEIIKFYRQKTIADLSNTTTITPSAYTEAVNFMLIYWKNNEYRDAGLIFFENLLMVLCNPKTVAEDIAKTLTDNKLILNCTGLLTLHVAENSKNDKLWLSAAHQLFKVHKTVAERLLDYYELQDMKKEFHQVADQVLNANKGGQAPYVEYIKDKIDYTSDPKLYLYVWEFYTQSKKDLDGYIRLSKYWTKTQKEVFIEGQKNNVYFYAVLLHHEERYDALLAWIERHKGLNNYSMSGGIDFYQYVPLIGTIFPARAYELMELYLLQDHKGMKMDRNGYARFCSNFKYFRKIKGMEMEKRAFIERLRSANRNRPAFQEELSKAL
jgi:hypothetical protein